MASKGFAISNDFGRGLARVQEPSPDGVGGKTKLAYLLDNTGARDRGLLRVASSVVDQDTFTIGNTVFIVEELNTAVTGLTAIQLTATNTGTLTATSGTVFLVGATHVFVPGDCLLLGSEVVLITSVLNDGSYTVLRGYAGTTAATHAANATIRQSASPGTNVALGYVLVPIGATLTNVTFVPRFVAVVNAFPKAIIPLISQGITPFDGFNADNVAAVALETNSVVLVSAKLRGSFGYATTNSTRAGNAWDSAVLQGGNNPVRAALSVHARTPLAAEVSSGKLYFLHDFPASPTVVFVQVVDGGFTGSLLAWGGTIAVVAPVSGANVADVQTLTIGGGTPTAGTFHLVLTDPRDGVTTYATAEIPYNASAAVVQSAIQSAIGQPDNWPDPLTDPDVEVTGTALPGGSLVITFGGRWYGDVPDITTVDTGLTAGASAIADTTEGTVGTGVPIPGYVVLTNNATNDWDATDLVQVVMHQ